MLSDVKRLARLVFLVAAGALVGVATLIATAAAAPALTRSLPDPALLRNCSFVSVDVQEAPPRGYVTEDTVPKLWKSMGITAPDVNAATHAAGAALRTPSPSPDRSGAPARGPPTSSGDRRATSRGPRV